MTCPFCESADVEDVSQWGGQIITRQLRCRSCNSYFEAIRDEFVTRAEPSEAPLRPAPPPPRAA